MLSFVLEHEPDLECVGQASDVAEAMDVLAATGVDVVLMDHDLPGLDGIEGIRRVKRLHPEIRTLIIVACPALDLLVRAASAGADGLMAKDSSLDDLLASIRCDTGDLELSPDTMEAVRQRVQSGGWVDGHRWDPHLTERERDVLALLGSGLDPQSIARHLRITVHTSRSYVRNVLSKLGAHTQLEAVIMAARAGIISGLCDCDQRNGRSHELQDVAPR